MDKRLHGEYVGFAPTDESRIALGEMRVVIDDVGVKVQHATGLRLDEAEYAISEFKRMSPKEVQALFKEGTSTQNIEIYTIGTAMKLMFLLDETESPSLNIIGNEMSDILGPTVLCSPEQIQNGLLDRIITSIEKECGKGQFPTIAAGGKHPNAEV